MDVIDNLLTRRVTNIIPDREALDKLLRGSKKLNIYLGIDPTATRIHIGHAVPLRKLNEFALNGHNVTFLIGDFTALIGDTADKDKERPVLTYEEIQENFKTYKLQAEKLIDFNKVNVVNNSEWLKELNFADIVKLCQHFSVGDFVGRELIRNRLTSGNKVGLHEVLYPVMQGFDSYHLDTDVQIGGADQTFNMQAGRTLQKDLRGKESFVMVTGYLEGTDGRKMSKSWGNAIWLTDEPEDMYGKIMSLRDELIPQYFHLATELQEDEITEAEKSLESGTNPMELKAKLAAQIVTELYSKEAAEEATEHFTQTFREGAIPGNIKVVRSAPLPAIEVLVYSGIAESRSEAKRLIQEGAVVLDGKKIMDFNRIVEPTAEGVILKAGKRRFVKLVNAKHET